MFKNPHGHTAILFAFAQAAAEVSGELEEAKEGRSASEAEVKRLHSQLLRLEENAEADLAAAANQVLFHSLLTDALVEHFGLWLLLLLLLLLLPLLLLLLLPPQLELCVQFSRL